MFCFKIRENSFKEDSIIEVSDILIIESGKEFFWYSYDVILM